MKRKMRIMAVRYGYAEVEATSEKEAVEIGESMKDHDYDWSDFDDVQVVDDDIDSIGEVH